MILAEHRLQEGTLYSVVVGRCSEFFHSWFHLLLHRWHCCQQEQEQKANRQTEIADRDSRQSSGGMQIIGNTMNINKRYT